MVSICKTVLVVCVSVMVSRALLVLALSAAAAGLELTGAQYYSMPQLFHLDDYEECLASRRGVYCLGTFDLLQYKNDNLYTLVQEYSSDRYHFNHSKIHRGYCLSSTCSHIEGPSLSKRFERCANNLTRTRYGLETKLSEFQYCRTARTQKQVDTWDLSFACIAGVVLLLNVMGTAYDVLRSQDSKPIKQLAAWSLVANWQRLTADYSGGDPRLSALKPVQGMKAMTLIMVLLAHAVLAHTLTYQHNPQFLETASQHVLSAYLQNGTSIVQSFILISSFLLAYNLLLHAGKDPKKPFGLNKLPKCLMHRISRISPLYLFTLGVSTTWWSHSGAGPLWAPLVEREAARCRHKWWAQAAYVSNFVSVDDKCLIHTWFLSVDMQLYLVGAVLTLALCRRPRVAVRILAALLLASVAMNFAIIHHWELLPMVKLMIPELMRTQFVGERSFSWLYSAPWDSLPAALVGLLVAFLHYNQQNDGIRPADSLVVRILYRSSVPCMFAWVVCGYFIKTVSSSLCLQVYAAVDRPVFVSLTAVAMYGFFNKIDSVWWKLMSWRGWEVLGRMSLSIYLVHWLLALLLVASKTTLASVSVLDIGGHWLTTIFLSYCAALPLHLLIELPATRFLQSLTP